MTRTLSLEPTATISPTDRIRDYDQLTHDAQTRLSEALRTETPLELPQTLDHDIRDGDVVNYTQYVRLERRRRDSETPQED